MTSFSVPNFAVELLGPQTLKFPNALKHKAYYDAAQQKLHFVGAMTDAERSVLLGVSNDASYRTALDQLFAAPDCLRRNPAMHSCRPGMPTSFSTRRSTLSATRSTPTTVSAMC